MQRISTVVLTSNETISTSLIVLKMWFYWLATTIEKRDAIIFNSFKDTVTSC
jgi:hypothetical protein